jgi:dTMP kinase
MTSRRGVFITFEGPDGSGKSTQMRLLAERLRKAGHRILESVEPGGTPIGRQIRRILLDPANQELCATAELLLMFAARAQNVEQWILPALAEGKIVLSDRFTDSTVAYQGAGRNLGIETVMEIDRIACHGVVPDLTLVIDIDAEAGLARAHRRNRSHTGAKESRIDEQAVEFHRKVREAYHLLAAREPQRVRLIDGNAAPEVIAESVWEAVRGFLPTATARRSGSSQYCS